MTSCHSKRKQRENRENIARRHPSITRLQRSVSSPRQLSFGSFLAMKAFVAFAAFSCLLQISFALHFSWDGGKFMAHLTYNKNTDMVNASLEVKTKGWVGFGFAKEKNGAMKNYDIIVGGVKDNGDGYLKVSLSASVEVVMKHSRDNARGRPPTHFSDLKVALLLLRSQICVICYILRALLSVIVLSAKVVMLS